MGRGCSEIATKELKKISYLRGQGRVPGRTLGDPKDGRPGASSSPDRRDVAQRLRIGTTGTADPSECGSVGTHQRADGNHRSASRAEDIARYPDAE